MSLKELVKEVKRVKGIKEVELKELFSSYTSVKFLIKNSKSDQFIIVHPSSRGEYKYQISLFDGAGAIMDGKFTSIDEVIEELLKGVVYGKSREVYYKYELMEVI